MYLMGGNVYIVADEELWFHEDGSVARLKTEWTWPGMQIIRAHTAETYVVIDREGTLEEVTD